MKKVLRWLGVGGIVAAIAAAIFGGRDTPQYVPFETERHTAAINALFSTLGYRGDRQRQTEKLLLDLNEPIQRHFGQNFLVIRNASLERAPGGKVLTTEYGWGVLQYVVENGDLRDEINRGLRSGDPERVRQSEGLLMLAGYDVTIDGVITPAEEAMASDYEAELLQSDELTKNIAGAVSPHLENLTEKMGLSFTGEALRTRPDVPAVDPVTYPAEMVIVFDPLGRTFAAASNSARQANEQATKACFDQNGPRRGTCYGVPVSTKGIKTCVAIGVDFLLTREQGRGKTVEEQTVYVIERAEQPGAARELLDEQCEYQHGKCKMARAVHCNYKPE